MLVNGVQLWLTPLPIYIPYFRFYTSIILITYLLSYLLLHLSHSLLHLPPLHSPPSSIRMMICTLTLPSLDRLRIDPTCPEWERRFFRRYYRLSFSHRHDRAEKAWNGTLNPTDLQSLLGSHSQLSLSFVQFQEFRKRVVHFVSPLTEAAISMERLQRHSRIRASQRSLPASSRRLSVPHSITRPPAPSIQT
jgi:hypothetical protein